MFLGAETPPPLALRGPSQSGPSPGTATPGCGQGQGVLMRRAAPSLRARVLPGHAVEGDAALCRLRGPGQLGLPERGVSPWARPPSPSSPKGRPRASQLRRSLRRPQVQKQETWVFLAYGVGVGLWLVISSLPRRRLVLNHTRGVYHFSIQGRTVCQGPLHLVYVRLALNSDGDWPGGWARDWEAAWEVRGAVRPAESTLPAAYGRCFFQLVLGGHRLEPLVLVQLSERYEVGSAQTRALSSNRKTRSLFKVFGWGRFLTQMVNTMQSSLLGAGEGARASGRTGGAAW